MNFDEINELLKPQPASIKAESDSDCKSRVEIRGRGAEVLALSMDIVDSVLEKTPFSIDDFCKIFKDAKKHKSTKEINDATEQLIKKILEDM